MAAAIKLSSPATNEFWEVPVLFEDEHLLAVDKPAGLLASPDRFDPARPNLMKLLHTGITEKKPWALDRGLSYLMNAHRPDLQTSGVMLLAKRKQVLIQLVNLFGSEKVQRQYFALIQGSPPGDAFSNSTPLSPHPHIPGKMKPDPRHGKKSSTRFQVLERFRGWTWLLCEPLTGRTHQIRVHLQQNRFPIAGDELYGGRPLLLSRLKDEYRLKPGRQERPLIDRVALHAAALTLVHPATGNELKIEAPLPRDLTVALKYLRRYVPDQVSGDQPL